MTALSRGFILLVLVFLYLPIVIMALMAFNASPLYAMPFQFSTEWFVALSTDDVLLAAGRNSVLLAVATAILGTLLGTGAAVALHRARFRGRATLRLLLLPPIAIPWLITGTAMLLFFFWTGIGRGLHAMLIGHVALAIPYVVLVVNAGLTGVRRDLEEAARSLGSTPLHAFFAVTFPMLLPSIVAAALFAFAVSLDQFVISYFLATPGVATLPVQIYAAIRKGFTPEINAISTILLGVSMIVILGFAWLTKAGGALERR
jgi:spermidine/putrescine transport system permease protein